MRLRERGYASGAAVAHVLESLRRDGIFARPLGNVVYLMGTPWTPAAEGRRLAEALLRAGKNMSSS